MPWRETRDPYAIWVSEIMLQQTRVETVIPYFRAWMERFPTVEALADAGEEEVLKRWEGLGYYSRARNLKRAAEVVRERHDGRIPSEVKALRALPGVGAYTAGAVGSIAFGVPVPAVDGNVRRVASRLLDLPDPDPRALEATVGAWVSPERPGDFNQALMELGATVRTPRNPRCDTCPVSRLCGALEAGTVALRPARRRKTPVRREREAVGVVVEAGPEMRMALRRRPSRGLLAGLWEVPGVRMEPGDDPGEVAAKLFADPAATPLPEVRHAFTHLHVTYAPYLVRRSAGSAPPAGTRWFTPAEIRGLPLPVAQQSIVESALAALEAGLT